MNRILKTSSMLLASAVVVQVAMSTPFAEPTRGATTQVAPQSNASVHSQPPAAKVADEERSRPDAIPFFEIATGHGSGGGDREIQVMAAELISRQAERDRTVPDGRAGHFSWIKLPILGWRGQVLDQAVVPTGLRVRVRVCPDLGGGICAVGCFADETYLIKDGVARLTATEYSKCWGIITFN